MGERDTSLQGSSLVLAAFKYLQERGIMKILALSTTSGGYEEVELFGAVTKPPET